MNILQFFFFFFQAEDGIRDATVTGVQTCALPIFPSTSRRWPTSSRARRPRRSPARSSACAARRSCSSITCAPSATCTTIRAGRPSGWPRCSRGRSSITWSPSRPLASTSTTTRWSERRPPMDQSLVIPSLAVTPRLLRALCDDATPDQVWASPKPGEWSIGDVVRHLLAADQRVFLPRLDRMLAEARPTFASVEDVLAAGRELAPLLDAFTSTRGELVSLLEPLASEAWRREGVVPRGPVSVASYANIVAEHDIEHRRQIHDLRQGLGLKPKQAEAKRPLPMAEIIDRK